jgi:excinuclease ABC subunit A
MNVGLDYLALSRSSKSLSGGEAKHPFGNSNWFTVGILYILMNQVLVYTKEIMKTNSFSQKRDIGNSVIVSNMTKDMIVPIM